MVKDQLKKVHKVHHKQLKAWIFPPEYLVNYKAMDRVEIIDSMKYDSSSESVSEYEFIDVGTFSCTDTSDSSESNDSSESSDNNGSSDSPDTLSGDSHSESNNYSKDSGSDRSIVIDRYNSEL